MLLVSPRTKALSRPIIATRAFSAAAGEQVRFLRRRRCHERSRDSTRCHMACLPLPLPTARAKPSSSPLTIPPPSPQQQHLPQLLGLHFHLKHPPLCRKYTQNLPLSTSACRSSRLIHKLALRTSFPSSFFSQTITHTYFPRTHIPTYQPTYQDQHITPTYHLSKPTHPRTHPPKWHQSQSPSSSSRPTSATSSSRPAFPSRPSPSSSRPCSTVSAPPT